MKFYFGWLCKDTWVLGGWLRKWKTVKHKCKESVQKTGLIWRRRCQIYAEEGRGVTAGGEVVGRQGRGRRGRGRGQPAFSPRSKPLVSIILSFSRTMPRWWDADAVASSPNGLWSPRPRKPGRKDFLASQNMLLLLLLIIHNLQNLPQQIFHKSTFSFFSPARSRR